MDRIDFPLTGNTIIMAIVILIHVFFAFIAVGGSVIAVFSEWLGRKKNDNDYILLARRLTEFLADMMKINGVLGVAIVVLAIGLWGSFSRLLYSVMFWPFIAEGLFFLLLMIFSVSYNNTWNSVSSKIHIFFGVMTAISAIATVFLINAIWAFMMVPGDWPTTRDRWDAFLNPILFESFAHMLLPCFINAALAIFLWTYWKSRKGDQETGYYRKANKLTAGIGALFIFLQPLSGLSFLFKVKSTTQNLPAPNPWSQLWTGMARPYFHTMMTLAGIAVIFAILYWVLGHEKGRKFLVVTAMAAFVAFFMGGYAREKARKPYLIWGTMHLNQKMVGEKAPAADEKEISGEQVLADWECRACHVFRGKGGSVGPELLNLENKFSLEDLKRFLKDPPEDMPPFDGSDEETEALAKYLIEGSRR